MLIAWDIVHTAHNTRIHSILYGISVSVDDGFVLSCFRFCISFSVCVLCSVLLVVILKIFFNSLWNLNRTKREWVKKNRLQWQIKKISTANAIWLMVKPRQRLNQSLLTQKKPLSTIQNDLLFCNPLLIAMASLSDACYYLHSMDLML